MKVSEKTVLLWGVGAILSIVEWVLHFYFLDYENLWYQGLQILLIRAAKFWECPEDGDRRPAFKFWSFLSVSFCLSSCSYFLWIMSIFSLQTKCNIQRHMKSMIKGDFLNKMFIINFRRVLLFFKDHSYTNTMKRKSKCHWKLTF